MNEIEKSCNNCARYNKRSKTTGECLNIVGNVRNIKTGGTNQVYFLVYNWNTCIHFLKREELKLK